MHNAITDVVGIRVGHDTDNRGATGCTVILCPEGAVAGVDVRGAAPGTRETDLLRPTNLVQQVHAILLAGGSAFGLEAAGGVMGYLEERGYGFETPSARVPIVPAAIIYDLGIGDPKARPDAAAGYRACLAAQGGPIGEGSVGAGTGATVGKALGLQWATKGGLGTASQRLADGAVVAALVVVNALGDVVDPETGAILAGPRREEGGFHNTVALLRAGLSKTRLGERQRLPLGTNTTLGVVATDAPLSKEQANRLATMAHDGLARALRPSHTMGDGDVVFALSLGSRQEAVDLTALGALAAEVVAQAIVRGITQAQGLAGIPAARELV